MPPETGAPATSVDEYLAGLPRGTRTALERLRQTIQAAAPMAEEVISYRIPLYKYRGHLVGFAAFKNHCSLFVTNSEVLRRYRKELAPFTIKNTAIHFTADRPLPDELVRRIVRTRVAENSAHRK